MLLSFLCRLFATRWYVRYFTSPRDWRYRIGFAIFSRAWRRDDDTIGRESFPHFHARDMRMRRGEMIDWVWVKGREPKAQIGPT